MKRFFIIAAAVVVALSSINTPVNAQTSNEKEETFKKERRIYLWDVTISMVGATKNASCPKAQKRTNPDYSYSEGYPNYNASKDIFDNTREKLIKMIYQIQNESTEVIVLPFRDGIVGEFSANATASGKEQLKNLIMGWNDLHSGGTFTATCLKDAVNKYFKEDKINRLFLLTDGEPSGNEGNQLLAFLRQWKGVKETKGQSSYLVYVMLTDEAFNQGIIDTAEESGGDITVTETFEEPVWLSLRHSATIHVRDYFNGKISNDGRGSFEIPYSYITGNSIPENSVFHFEIEGNDYIDVDSTAPVRPSDGKFTVPFRFKKGFEECLSELPQEFNLSIPGVCRKDGTANKNIILVGSSAVDVSLVIKSEPRVKISWSTNEKED